MWKQVLEATVHIHIRSLSMYYDVKYEQSSTCIDKRTIHGLFQEDEMTLQYIKKLDSYEYLDTSNLSFQQGLSLFSSVYNLAILFLRYDLL